MSEPIGYQPDDEHRPAPTDPALRERVLANAAHLHDAADDLGMTPEFAELCRMVIDTTRDAVEIHASPDSPWTAPTPDAARRRWTALVEESARFRAGLERGQTPEQLGARTLGQGIAEVIRRTHAS